MLSPDDFTSLIAMLIPIIAIVGGLTIALARVLGQIRLEELARRERIAAIERGVDLDKLPSLPGGSDEGYRTILGNGRLRRAHGLMIAGLVLLAVGVSLGAFLHSVESDHKVWVLGLLPFLVGVALMVGSLIVWPRKG
jgi:hypothetical protein